MAEPSLDCPGVVTLVGECVATGVAEHVRVRLQLGSRGARCPFNHPGKAGRRERRSPFAYKHTRRGFALALKPAQGPELVAAQGVGAESAVLGATVRLRMIPRGPGDRGDVWNPDDRAMSRQSPRSLWRMLPPLAQNTSATPISEPPATTPDATGKVNSLASFGLRLSITSATRAPRKNKSP